MTVSFVVLGLVCLAAYVVLKWLSRRGVATGGRVIRVIDRCPLEPRRSVYVIEAGGKTLLVGVGEGPMSVLAELEAVKVATPAAPKTSFARVLERVAGRRSDAEVP